MITIIGFMDIINIISVIIYSNSKEFSWIQFALFLIGEYYTFLLKWSMHIAQQFKMEW